MEPVALLGDLAVGVPEPDAGLVVEVVVFGLDGHRSGGDVEYACPLVFGDPADLDAWRMSVVLDVCPFLIGQGWALVGEAAAAPFEDMGEEGIGLDAGLGHQPDRGGRLGPEFGYRHRAVGQNVHLGAEPHTGG